MPEPELFNFPCVADVYAIDSRDKLTHLTSGNVWSEPTFWPTFKVGEKFYKVESKSSWYVDWQTGRMVVIVIPWNGDFPDLPDKVE